MSDHDRPVSIVGVEVLHQMPKAVPCSLLRLCGPEGHKTLITRDGTLASLAPLIIASILLFAPTLYIALDTSHSWSTAFRLDGETRAVALFVLTLVWPAA